MKKAEYIRPEIMTVDVLTESSYALTVTGIGGDGGEGGPGTIGDGGTGGDGPVPDPSAKSFSVWDEE
jgi:hypothetical protein